MPRLTSRRASRLMSRLILALAVFLLTVAFSAPEAPADLCTEAEALSDRWETWLENEMPEEEAQILHTDTHAYAESAEASIDPDEENLGAWLLKRSRKFAEDCLEEDKENRCRRLGGAIRDRLDRHVNSCS